MLRFPNMVSMSGLFKTGTPNYFDVSLGEAATGPNGETCRTFAEAATDDAWADGDTLGVLAVKGTGEFKVWTATWDASNQFLERVTEELTAGTWTTDDAATISAVSTENLLLAGQSTPTRFQPVVVTGTTYTLTANDAGKTICCTNATSCAVTADDALPVNFQVQLVQEGGGTITVDVEGSDTINGNVTGTGVASTDQYTSLFLYQRQEGAWICVGGA